MNTTTLTLTAAMNDVESGISVASVCAAPVGAPRVRRPIAAGAWSEPVIALMDQADHDKFTRVSVPGRRGVT